MTKNNIALEIAATKARLVEMERVAAEERQKAAEKAAAAELQAAEQVDEAALIDGVRELWAAYVQDLSIGAYVKFSHTHEDALREINHARNVLAADRNRLAQAAAGIVDRWHSAADEKLRNRIAAEFETLTGVKFPTPDGRTQQFNGSPALSPEQIPSVAKQRPAKLLEAIPGETGRYLPRNYRDAVDQALAHHGVR